METVYFIGSTERGTPVKIGFTKNVQKRLCAIQHGSALRLAVLATLDGGRKLEQALHARYRASRLSGEWFAPSQILEDDIRAINSGTFKLIQVDRDAEDLRQAAEMLAEGRKIRNRVLARLRKRKERAVKKEAEK